MVLVHLALLMKANDITICQTGPILSRLEKLCLCLFPFNMASCLPQRLVGRHRDGRNRVASVRVMTWIDIEEHVDDEEQSKCSNAMKGTIQTLMQVGNGDSHLPMF